MKPKHRLSYAAQAYARASKLVNANEAKTSLLLEASLALFREAITFTKDLDGNRITVSSGSNIPFGYESHVRSYLDVLTESEGFHRASGECRCESCGKKYWVHPMDGPDSFDGNKFLHRLCNGDLVKL